MSFFVDIPQSPRVMQLLAEIDKVKDAQLAGYAKGGSAANNEKIQLNLNALAALDAADFYNDGMC